MKRKEVLPADLEKLIAQPLLQYYELNPAGLVAEPLSLSVDTLELWYTVAKAVCDTGGYQAVAFTELSRELQTLLGFGPKLPPRVIFYRNPQIEPEGMIFINPQAEALDESVVLRFEQCGSVGYSRLGYFILRPERVQIAGIGFKIGESGPRKTSMVSEDPFEDVSFHEIAHLDGWTCLDDRWSGWDFRKPSFWEVASECYPDYTQEELIRVAFEITPNGILVRDQGQYAIVEANRCVTPFIDRRRTIL